MADNVTLPGTGALIAADETTDATLGTVKFQYVKLVDGTLDGTTKVAATSNGLKVDGSAVTQPVSGTVSANAGTGTFATGGNVASAATDSGNPVKTGGVFNTTQPTVTNGQRVDAQMTARGAQIVSTGADTFDVTVNSALPTGSNVVGGVTQSGTWTVQPGNTANSTAWITQSVAGTSGGWSVSSQTALLATKTQVKASAGNCGGYMFYNPNAAVQYIQVWDVALASVTVGTTAPTYVIPIPPSSGANLELSRGIGHVNAIVIACTTTPTGSGAPGTAIVGFILYK